MAVPLDPVQARALALGIRGSRQAVAAVYNQVVQRTGTDLDDFKTVALGIDDPVEAFTRALMSAAGGEVPCHHVLLAELAAQGLIDPAVLAQDAAPVAVTLMPQNGDGTWLEPQAFTPEMMGVLPMAELIAAINLAARRLCLIKAGGSQGTGFLIGPHTVLTNWHVMSGLIDAATRKARPGSARDILVSFETLADNQGRPCQAAEDWLAGFSPMAKLGEPPPPSPDGTFLDYCAIRLQGAPGRERGWYDLAQTGALNNKTDAFFVFQHPAGASQRAGVGRDTVPDTNPDFLRHQVWTASGSSGGLCLDHALRPIALHHAAIFHATEKDANGKPKLEHNRAVRLSSIHAVRPDLGAPDPRLDRIARLSDGSAAVVGRVATQATLRRMAVDASKPILVVRGDRQSGKSFTTMLLRESFPFDSLRIIRLSADDLKAEAADLARLILERAGKDLTEIDTAFRNLASLTTGPATVSDVFVTMKTLLLGIASASPVQPYVLWLVIDQLDLVPLPGIGARSLLEKIYNDSALLAVMRVILIGLTDVLTSVDPQTILTDKLDDPHQLKRDEIEECLSGLMVAAGVVPFAGEARRHAEIVLGATEALDPRAGQTTRLAVLSGLLSGVYMKAVDGWR